MRNRPKWIEKPNTEPLALDLETILDSKPSSGGPHSPEIRLLGPNRASVSSSVKWDCFRVVLRINPETRCLVLQTPFLFLMNIPGQKTNNNKNAVCFKQVTDHRKLHCWGAQCMLFRTTEMGENRKKKKIQAQSSLPRGGVTLTWS